MITPLFSVIIPVYNSEKYLKKCINSVIAQKHNKTEIILIEDCSTDNSLKVCNSFKKNSSVNIVRHKKNFGVSIARNNGILVAKGKYILFLDSDDWLYPGSLKGVEKLIIKNPNTEVIIGRYNSDGFPFNNKILFKGTNSKIFTTNKFFKYINKIDWRPMIIWHKKKKKSLINDKKLYYISVKNGEDEEFGARLLFSMKQLSLYKKNYYWHKTRRENSLRYSRDKKATESYLKVLVEYYKFIGKIPLSNDKKVFINKCINFAYGEISARIILHNKIEIKKLSFKLKKYLGESKIFLNKIKNKNIYSLLKNKNISQHKNLITKNILNNVRKTKFKYREIYIYCASVHGVATLNILQKNRLKVTSLVDDNIDIEKQTLVNVDVISGKTFLGIKKEERSKILILVCQQTAKTFDIITKKLKLKGIKNNQIIHVMY